MTGIPHQEGEPTAPVAQELSKARIKTPLSGECSDVLLRVSSVHQLDCVGQRQERAIQQHRTVRVVAGRPTEVFAQVIDDTFRISLDRWKGGETCLGARRENRAHIWSHGRLTEKCLELVLEELLLVGLGVQDEIGAELECRAQSRLYLRTQDNDSAISDRRGIRTVGRRVPR